VRTVSAGEIESAVARACAEACLEASEELVNAFKKALETEVSEVGRWTLERLIENTEIARAERIPICQDTGLAVFFVELGEGVRIEGGSLPEAINQGMVRAYQEAYLRKSTCHCLTRKNYGDNAPAFIHYELAPGDELTIHFMAKGGGSENMGAVGLLKPAQGWPGIREFVVETLSRAGPNPCPPVIVGVGVGGPMEVAALNSKKALLRRIGEPSPDPELAQMEAELLEKINDLGVGPEGFGGRNFALGVHLVMAPCHLASLPVAVSLACQASRHRTIKL